MSIIKRGNSKCWYIQFQLNGRTYIRSSRTTVKKLAEQMEADWRVKLHAQQFMGKKQRITLRAAVEQFCQSKVGTANHFGLVSYAKQVNRLLPAHKYLDELTSHDMERFKQVRLSEGVQPQTIKHGLHVVRAAWKFAKKLGFQVGELDFPQIKLPRYPLRYLTDDEERRLLNELDPNREWKGRPTVELWAALLREQPNARLMLLTVSEGTVRNRLQRRFADLGVDSARLTFCGKLPLSEFHRRILDADIALDPVTVNGGTTTCESLWLGVPVISLTGKRFLSRAGTSILNALGMGDLACATAEQYLHTAASLAGDLPLLADIRSGLRARMCASPLIDKAAYVRDLEAAYRQIWTHWCESGKITLSG